MFQLNHLKTGKRMFLGFGIIISFFLTVSIISWVQLTIVNRNMDRSLLQAKTLLMVKEIDITLGKMYLDIWSLLTSKASADKQKYLDAAGQQHAAYQKILDGIKNETKVPSDLELIAALENAVEQSRNVNNYIIDIALQADYQSEEAQDLFVSDGMASLQNTIKPALNAIIENQQEKLLSIDTAAEAAFLFARFILGFGMIISLGVSFLLGILLTRSFVLPLADMVTQTERLAKGDFSLDIPAVYLSRRDEMGILAQAYSTMIRSIRTLIESIRSETANLSANGDSLSANMTETAASMNQISTTTMSMKNQTINQSASVTQTHATLEEIQNHIRTLNDLIESQAASVVESSSSNEQMVANIKSVVAILQKNFVSMVTQTGRPRKERTALPRYQVL